MAPGVGRLLARQSQNCTRDADGFYDEENCLVPFWATRTGVIVKWSLFFGLIAVVLLYLLIGWLHARSRLKKGLVPRKYHRFLVSRAALARVDPNYRYPEPASIDPYAPEGQYYDMHAIPPPVYDPNAPRPPMYEPPAGSSKVDSNQHHGDEEGQRATGAQSGNVPPPSGPPPSWDQSQEMYAPPPGPPPSSVPPEQTGSTNPIRN
ncbi:hypothetical protein VTK26DRAFT_5233 [Humicola hyalothermophila]